MDWESVGIALDLPGAVWNPGLYRHATSKKTPRVLGQGIVLNTLQSSAPTQNGVHGDGQPFRPYKVEGNNLGAPFQPLKARSVRLRAFRMQKPRATAMAINCNLETVCSLTACLQSSEVALHEWLVLRPLTQDHHSQAASGSPSAAS